MNKKKPISGQDKNNFYSLVEIASSLFYGTTEHYRKTGIQYADVPAIVGITGACENVDTLFKIGNRLDLPLFFTQTGQLGLEQVLQYVHGAYTIIKSGRDEEFEDERHLRQFVLTEEEFDCTYGRMTRFTYDEEIMFELLLAHVEASVKAMMRSVSVHHGEVLTKQFGRDSHIVQDILERPFPRIVYSDAVKLLQKNGYPSVHFGDDLKSDHEAKVVELVNRSKKGYGTDISRWSPVLIMRYPKEIKFFNMKVSQGDARVVLSADCIFPYAGEGVGSAVREHDGEKLKQRLLNSTMFQLHTKRGGSYEDFTWYTEDIIGQKKTLPHAGYGIGNERVLQFLLGQPDIRIGSLFSLMSKQTNDWDRNKRGYASFYAPKKHILLSIGKISNKKKILSAVSVAKKRDVILYATQKTHEFFKNHAIETTLVHKIQDARKPNIRDLLGQHLFDIVINIPTQRAIRGKEYTDGQFIRSKAIDTGTTLVTDISVAERMLLRLADTAREYSDINVHVQPGVERTAQSPVSDASVVRNALPTYDISKSYDWNFEFGPHFNGQFPVRDGAAKQKFLSFSVNSHFGIPAGPLLNSRWIDLYARLGFDILTYKTVRTRSYPAHAMPNMLYVEHKKTKDKQQLFLGKPYIPNFDTLTMTNSFGVPSKDPDVWQEDVQKSMRQLADGQLLIVSIMGTREAVVNEKAYAEDFVKCALLAKEAGAAVIEVNLSCPNLGNSLVCNDTELSAHICSRIKNAIGNTPLIAKISYLRSDEELRSFLEKTNEFLGGIAAINTIKGAIDDLQVKRSVMRTITESGVCGEIIKPYGLSMVERLSRLRKEWNLSFAILGMGGVTKADDYEEYRKSGADVVMSATGAMWNPYLAHEIHIREIEKRRDYAAIKSLSAKSFHIVSNSLSLKDLRTLYMDMVFPQSVSEEKRTLLIREKPFLLKHGEHGKRFSHIYMNHRHPVFTDAGDRRLLVKIFDAMTKEYICKKWSKNGTYGVIAIPSSSSPELTSSLLDAFSGHIERTVVVPNYFLQRNQGDERRVYGDIHTGKPWVLIDDVFTSGDTMKNAMQHLPKWLTDATGVPRLFSMALVCRNPDIAKNFTDKTGSGLHYLVTLDDVLQNHWKNFSSDQKRLIERERPQLH